MRIFLIRHGEAEKADKDPSLSEKGILQARNVAGFLKDIKINHSFTSNLARAKQTFEEYRKVDSLSIVEHTEDLNEIYRVIIGGPEKEGTSQGREEKDMIRADKFFERLRSMKSQNVALFIHGNIIRYYLSKAMGVDPRKLWKGMVISPGSISIIEIEGKILQVKAVNLYGHQSKELTEEYYQDQIKSEGYLP